MMHLHRMKVKLHLLKKSHPEQQAAIDALDKPVMDEKNTDIPESVANAPADAATPATEEEAGC
jgi:hypothetical protein